MQKHPELELVKNSEILKALHETEPNWWIFISRDRGVVEVHDVRLVNCDDFYDSHIMTEEYVSWKIPHDAKKFNSKVFDINELLDDEEAREDRADGFRLKQQSVERRMQARNYLMHN